MARVLTAIVGTPGVTYCSRSGVPYRCDDIGVIHVEAAHVAELTNRGLTLATTATIATNHHKGETLTPTAENY